ncbi:MAG: glutathione S-transferase [Verrucomicrobiales bacterium]|jgi:glutathione S-transferase
MAHPTLISSNLCPFVQRSVITLEEKAVPYDIEYVDLYAKPDWFLEISPFGKVPVLRVDNKALFESQVIVEYLDETAAPRMHPEDPLERAYHRAWIEFISAGLVDTFKLMVETDEVAARDFANSAREKLVRLGDQMGEGPFFSGGHFSLVDAAAAPMVQRLQWCENIKSLGIFEGHPKVAAWRDALLARPSVQRSVLPNIEEIFVENLKGRPSPAHTTEASWLGSLAD